MRFQDRVVLVTGAAKGIGASTVEAFAREGARLVLLDLDGAGVESLAKRVRDAGAEALTFTADAAAAAQVQPAVDAALSRWGRIDVLANVAGGFGVVKPTEAFTDAEWDGIIRSNLTSAFVCARAVVPAMKRQRHGRIVSVASIAGRSSAVRTASHYAAAKAGVIGFTRHLALEVAGDGITVNAVAPGTVASERVLSLRTPEETRKIAATMPVKRLGEPAEIAATILFLASDEASFVTGATLDVNGGQLMA